MNPYSRYLSGWQLRGLERLGDCYLPGTRTLPAFSATGSSAHIDEVLDGVDEADRRGLALLLTVLGATPLFLIRFLLILLDRHHRLPPPLAGPLRLLNLGLKGPVMTLYYSGLDGEGKSSGVHEAMGFELHCEPDGATQ
jgi:hypothetical protein